MKRTRLLKVAAISIGVVISFLFTEIVLRVQNFIQLDNFSNQSPWNEVLHHGTGKFTVRDYGSNSNGERIKILLLGDSWMEDEHLGDTIGQQFANKSGKSVQTINGGNSSYSPTLYFLKARQAFNTYGKFDYIIVNIDETDIGDEWLRCRIPTVRDRSGKIVAVPYSHDIAAQYLWNGKLWAENSSLYSLRLIKFTYFYKFLTPLLYRFTVSPDLYSNLMQYVFAPDARKLYKGEHQHFEDRLLEMSSELISFTDNASASRVYVTHHPHLRGLIDNVDDGNLYLPIVSETIARVKEKIGVTVLDANKHIMEIHGKAFQNNMFEPDDPFSHLTADGAIRYGKWIADQIGTL
jgi:hypothetical protein